MSMLLLKLRHAGLAKVTPAFRQGNAQVDFSEFQEDFPRAVRLDALNEVVNATMSRHPDAPTKDEERSRADAWLAPRLHAALRLTRREAADRGVWNYLALVQLDDYVRWRFP